MKYISLFIIAVALSISNCHAQDSIPAKKLYNAMFKWHITIPEGFNNMSPQDYARMQQKGTAAIEDTYNDKVINRSKPIFVFKSDQMHYFESNYQPFDVKIDGSHSASCKAVGDVLYNTFLKQLGDVKMDSAYTSEIVDKLKFRVFKLNIYLPNDNVLTTYMFSRLFGKQEFSVVMLFVDRKRGEELLNAFRTSTFDKNKPK